MVDKKKDNLKDKKKSNIDNINKQIKVKNDSKKKESILINEKQEKQKQQKKQKQEKQNEDLTMKLKEDIIRIKKTKTKKEKEINIVKIGVLVSFLAVIIINFLANYLPINSQTTGQISDKYSNLFAPIGFTFSIWGVIYLLLAIFVIYQFSKSYKNERILKLFIYTNLLNFAWIFAWHYEMLLLSSLLITTLLVTLFSINKEISIKLGKKHTLKELLIEKAPFSIYFGWISVATIANITTLLVSLNFNNVIFSNMIWTMIVLLVGLILGSFVGCKNKDVFYLLVFIWAYFGILSKHVLTFDFAYPYVVYTIIISMAVFLFMLYRVLYRLYYKNN